MNFKIKKVEVQFAVAATLVAMALGYIAGYRPFGTGFDFIQYDFFYADIRQNDDLSYFRFEPGYTLLAYFSKFRLELEYVAFAAIVGTVSLLVKFYTFRQLQYPLLAAFYYVAVWFPLFENTQVRVSLAISILFLAALFLLSRRWIAFIALSFLAFSFHMSAGVAAVVLALAYVLSSFSLVWGLLAAVVTCIVLTQFADAALIYGVALNATLANDAHASAVNIFSMANISLFLFLVATFLSGSLRSRHSRTFFLVGCFSFAFLLGLQSVPIMTSRFRELLAVFVTFIAFEYKITLKTIPQASLAFAQMLGFTYLYISRGFFSD